LVTAAPTEKFPRSLPADAGGGTMDIRANVQQLIAQGESGEYWEAYQAFYHEDVTMQENSDPPRTGLAEIMAMEQNVMKKFASIEGLNARAVLVDGNLAVIEWIFDATLLNGEKAHLEELALQTWDEGKIRHERFFYELPANLRMKEFEQNGIE
jgi:ketosteroid isomerase-like protein